MRAFWNPPLDPKAGRERAADLRWVRQALVVDFPFSGLGFIVMSFCVLVEEGQTKLEKSPNPHFSRWLSPAKVFRSGLSLHGDLKIRRKTAVLEHHQTQLYFVFSHDEQHKTNQTLCWQLILSCNWKLRKTSCVLSTTVVFLKIARGTSR